MSDSELDAYFDNPRPAQLRSTRNGGRSSDRASSTSTNPTTPLESERREKSKSGANGKTKAIMLDLSDSDDSMGSDQSTSTKQQTRRPGGMTKERMAIGDAILLSMAKESGFVPAVVETIKAKEVVGGIASGSGTSKGKSMEKGRKAAVEEAKKRKPATTAAKKGKKIRSPSPPPPPKSPGEFIDPNDSFWDVPVQSVKQVVAKRLVPGVASKYLASLSERGRALAPIVVDDDDDDDIEDPEENREYVNTEVGKRKRKAQQLEALKVSRLKKDKPVVAAPLVPAVPKNIFQQMSKSNQKEKCALCDIAFPADQLSAHAEACFNEFAADAAADATQLPPPVHRSPPPPPARRVPPAAPIPSDAQARLLDDLGFSPPRVVALDKGKGKAVRVIEDDEVEEEEEDEEIEDDDGYQIWPEAEEEGDGDYDEDEAEEEWERFVAPVDRARQNRSMMVNAMNSDGSSPPKGSIYISSMPREIKLAYEHMYTIKPARASKNQDPDAPQKLTTKRAYGGATRGKRGKARSFRGGARRGWKKK